MEQALEEMALRFPFVLSEELNGFIAKATRSAMWLLLF